MSQETKPANATGHGDYERRDIGVAGVLYFLLGLTVAGLFVHFVATGLFREFQKLNDSQQTAVSPLIRNAPSDTRHVPRDYPQTVFPNPKLEEDERGQLNGIRLKEEQTLSSYDYVDQKSGTVRIPIDRAMELIAQRGLPVRPNGGGQEPPSEPPKGSTKQK
jgi:hypothetical protein